MTTHLADSQVTNFSFNDHLACNAVAITVGGTEDHASCSTFIDTGTHGGLPKVLADVEACQRSECIHNDHLMCQAAEVHVGPGADNADCLTYGHRSGSAIPIRRCSGPGPTTQRAIEQPDEHRGPPAGLGNSECNHEPKTQSAC